LFNKFTTSILLSFLLFFGITHSIYGRQCPKLQINNIVVIPLTPTTLDPVRIEVQVINNSHVTGSGTLYLKVGDEANPSVYTIPDLHASKSWQVIRTVNLTEAKEYRVTATVRFTETDRCPEMDDKMSKSFKMIKADGKGIVSWDHLAGAWHLFDENMHIRLHNSNGHGYKNASELVFSDKSESIDFPMIEFERNGSTYRYLCNDLHSKDKGITLMKKGCGIQQLRMDIAFENEGTELKGYGKFVNWSDHLAPDVETDNGLLTVIFNFTSDVDAVDYTIDADFRADVKPVQVVWDWVMDGVLDGWNTDIREAVSHSVEDGLMDRKIKTNILDNLITVLKNSLGLTYTHIVKIQFEEDGIHIYY
jgi:hypothetical protein